MRWTRRILIALGLVAVSGVGALIFSAGPPEGTEVSAAIDQVVRTAMEDGPIAGVAVGVAQGRQIVHAGGYGLADVENDIPVTQETVFRVGSITKQFTAALVTQLVEDGALRLASPLTEYLPEYAEYGPGVTIESLLNHTAGVKNYTTMESWWQTLSVEMRPVDLVEVFRYEPLDFLPGARFSYSNSGYVLLGVAAERVGGRPFGGLLNERIVVPQALSRSGYCDDRVLVPNRARGYAVDEEELVNASYVSMSQAYAAGAVCSSAVDLLRWTRALARGEVVSSRSYDRMTTPGTLNDGTRIEYGYGMAVSFLEGRRRFTHVGGMLGFAGHLSYYPDDDLTIVVLTNTEESRAAGIESAIARVVFELDEATVRDLRLSDEELDGYTGEYDLTITRTTILPEDGRLTIDVTVPGLEGRHVLLYQGEQRFVAEEDPEISLTFALSGGTATGFELYHKGITMRAQRVQE